MRYIIGLAGPAGCGKDTVANELRDVAGFEIARFAAVLKRMLAVAGMPEPTREMKERPIPGLPFSWRHAAQTLGTEWGRQLDPDLWVKLTMRQLDPEYSYAISDVRFENEAKVIRDAGGLVVHITGRQAALIGGTRQHASEVGLVKQPSDYPLCNSGGMRELEEAVADLLRYVETRS